MTRFVLNNAGYRFQDTLYLACEEDRVKWQNRMSQVRLHESVECIVERLVLL